MSTRYQDRLPAPTNAQKRTTFFAASSSGDSTMIAASGNRVIKVYGVHVHASADVTVIFKSNTTAITAPITVGQYGGFVLANSSNHWFKTAAGAGLRINLSSAVDVAVTLIYTQE